jgi:hypothetical protein
MRLTMRNSNAVTVQWGRVTVHWRPTRFRLYNASPIILLVRLKFKKLSSATLLHPSSQRLSVTLIVTFVVDFNVKI